jgi:predicted nucleic acid-binding protein
MPIRTLYLDTSVISGYFDEEWQKGTRELWHLMELGYVRFVTSAVTFGEIVLAPKTPAHVVNLFNEHFDADTILLLSDEARTLAAAYIHHGVLTQKSLNDALQVAICTLADMDCLVSWNFKHLVGPERKKGFHAINLLQGRRPVNIVTPWEVVYEIK